MNISNLGFHLARKTRPIHLPTVDTFNDVTVPSPANALITFNPPGTAHLCEEPLLTVPKRVSATKRFRIPNPKPEDISHLLTLLPPDDSVEALPNQTLRHEPLLTAPGPAIVFQDFEVLIPAIGPGKSEIVEGTLVGPDQPEIESYLVPIGPPKISGRSYSRGSIRDKPKLPSARPTKDPIPGMCLHGNDVFLCSVCAGRKRNTKVNEQQIPDVFSQLWFVLQPPILERIYKPDVLPSGKKPYDFQIAGIKWLSDTPRALLADEMGLGKTIQAIMAIRVLFQRGELRKVLVVSPVSVAPTWMKELRDWAPELRGLRVNETAANRPYQWRTPAEVYVISYDMLRSDVSSDTAPISTFDLCVIDEAQNIKNPAAKRTHAVKQTPAKYRWALTGTPLENSLDDTISMFDFLDPTFIRNVLKGKRYISPQDFRREITPLTLRRTVEDVALDLPPLTCQEHWLELTGKQREAYNSTESYGVNDIKSLGQRATRIHVLALISKLKQLCNLDESTGQSCKLDFLQEQLSELAANGEKALVFSQYPNVTLRNISPRLQRFSPLIFDGSLSEQARTRNVEEFQEQENSKIMLMGVKSGGTGITLTRANHVFHFDHWWNPATEDQASKRAHRIGQRRPVFVTSLYTIDTIEERIYDLLERKRYLFREVFDGIGDEEVGKRLSDQELFGLFGLTAPPSDRSKVVSAT